MLCAISISLAKHHTHTHARTFTILLCLTTMPYLSPSTRQAPDGRIVAITHKRLTDEGATTSKALEVLCFLYLLSCVRMVLYTTMVMDGCRDLVEPARANGKRVQGDLWHSGKNWLKWARLAIPLLCRRPPKEASEKAANPRVEAVKLAPERLAEYGKKPQGIEAIDYAMQRVEELGGEADRQLGVVGLKQLFRQLATEQAMTEQERQQERQHEVYKAEQVRRKEAVKERSQKGDEASAAKATALPWLRDLRSMQRYVAEHTRRLRDEDNPSTAAKWTDDERGAEFLVLWRKGCVALVLGRTTDPVLLLLNHPCTRLEREKPWQPPGRGFVAAESFAFRVLDSLICDPVWDTKFPFLIDGRMTFMNESFFHVLRKWGNKHFHFSRFYSIAMWCAVLSWNENVTRGILEYVWSHRKSGQLKSSAGRAYRVPVRPPPTDRWRSDGWLLYCQWVRGKDPVAATPLAPLQSYDLGWHGADPTRLTPVQRAAPAAPADAPAPAKPNAQEMSATELRTELAALDVCTKGKKGELVVAVLAARADITAVRIAQAVPLARRSLPALPRDSPRLRRDRISNALLPTHGLPSPYRLPPSQRQKRKPPPSGQPQYTAARVTAALAAIAAGQPHTPLKRSRVGEDELVDLVGMPMDEEDEVASGAEGEEGEEGDAEMGE